MRTYTVLVLFLSSLEIAGTAILGEFGLSVLETCFLVNGSSGYWIAIVPLAINAPLIFAGILTVVRSKGYDKNKALKKTIRSCLSMVFTWGFPTITAAITTFSGSSIEILDYFSFLIGCSSGITLALCRLWSYEVLKRFCSNLSQSLKTGNQSTEEINDVLIQETSVNYFFNDITQLSTKDMIIILSLALIKSQECKENYCFSYKKHKFHFKLETYSILSPYVDISKQKLRENGIWEYEREFFRRIRQSCGISDEDLIHSLCCRKNFELLESFELGGKSGAFLFNTYDEKFFIKTVNRTERYLLLDILPAYCKHLTKHSGSKIVRILGLFKLTSTKESFIIMENIIRRSDKLKIYDLKGSTDNRYVDELLHPKAVLKDQNFINSEIKLEFTQKIHDEFLEDLTKDCKFLRKFNIIDYSMLLGIYQDHTKIQFRYIIQGKLQYAIGIIDFLQEYSLPKKLELLFKKIKGKSNTSVCSPGRYSSRFLSFISSICTSVL